MNVDSGQTSRLVKFRTRAMESRCRLVKLGPLQREEARQTMEQVKNQFASISQVARNKNRNKIVIADHPARNQQLPAATGETRNAAASRSAGRIPGPATATRQTVAQTITPEKVVVASNNGMQFRRTNRSGARIMMRPPDARSVPKQDAAHADMIEIKPATRMLPGEVFRREHTLQFRTRNDFQLALNLIDSRLCEHKVLDAFPSKEELKALCQGRKSKVIYLYPEEELTHVETLYIDARDKTIYFLPDSLYPNAEKYLDRCPENYKMALPAASLYLGKKCILQEDSESCSFIALQFGKKLERLNEGKIRLQNIPVGDMPAELGTTINGKEFSFRRGANADSRFSYYALPGNFANITQNRAPIIANELLHPIGDTVYPSHKVEKAEQWMQWFDSSMGTEVLNARQKYEDVSQNVTKESYAARYRLKTSPIRTELLSRLNRGSTSDQMMNIASEAFMSMGAFPGAEFMRRINEYRAQEGKQPVSGRDAFRLDIIDTCVKKFGAEKVLLQASTRKDPSLTSECRNAVLRFDDISGDDIAAMFIGALSSKDTDDMIFAKELAKKRMSRLQSRDASSMIEAAVNAKDETFRKFAEGLFNERGEAIENADIDRVLRAVEASGSKQLFGTLMTILSKRHYVVGAQQIPALARIALQHKDKILAGIAQDMLEKHAGAIGILERLACQQDLERLKRL